MPEKELLFRLTKKDFVETHIKGSGSGGQHRNKVATGVRLAHPPSGAVGQATDSKSQAQNRKAAFRRLVESDKFKAWHRIETAKHMMDEKAVDRKVDNWLRPKHIKVEQRVDGEWTDFDDPGREH